MDKNEAYRKISNILESPTHPQVQKQEVYNVLEQYAQSRMEELVVGLKGVS